MMMINFRDPMCGLGPWDRPCLPDGSSYPDPRGVILVFFAIYFVLILICIYESAIGRKRRAERLALQNARRAALRIPAALDALLQLQGDAALAASKSLASDLLLILDCTLYEMMQNFVRKDPDKVTRQAMDAAWQEALRLRRPLARARFFLRFKPLAARGQFLALKAAARYASVYTPALKRLHEKESELRDLVPIVEIEMRGDAAVSS